MSSSWGTEGFCRRLHPIGPDTYCGLQALGTVVLWPNKLDSEEVGITFHWKTMGKEDESSDQERAAHEAPIPLTAYCHLGLTLVGLG